MKFFMLSTLMFGGVFHIVGQEFGWAARLGGTNYDHACAVMVDDAGNVYTAGSYEGLADFDPGPGFAIYLSAGDADVFVTRQDPDGNLVWAISFGGTTEDYGEALVLDKAGNLYVSGYFNGTSDFDPGPGTANLTASGDYDSFIAKYDADGNFLWVKSLGGTDADVVKDVALDTKGNILMTGLFNGTADFDPGAGTYDLTSAGGNDIFIVKLDNAGELIWAIQFGDTGNDIAYGIAIDPNNNILTTGGFVRTVDFDPGAGIMNLTSNGVEDAFISKLDQDGLFIWALNFGSGFPDEGTAIQTDASGRVFTAGIFQNVVDFDPGPGVLDLASNGVEDIFISVLDVNGALIMARQMGGPMLDKPHAIDIDTAGNIYTAGYFSDNADFDPDTAEYFLTSAGGLDVFVSKLSASGKFQWAVQFGGTEDDLCLDMVVGDSAFVFTTGYFSGTADFDPGMDTFNLTADGNTDVFVVLLKQCLPVYEEIIATACDGYASPDGLDVWTVSGTYVDTIALIGGCDSIIIVHLTIINSTSSEISEIACDSYTSPDGLESWTVSGTYMDTISNSAGCDSIITVQLTIINSSASEISETACDSFTSPDGLETWTESGPYMDTLTNAAGCDSVITVHLTIINSTFYEIIAEACDSYDAPDGSETWTESGTYIITLVNSVGCDSIISVQLTIFNSTAAEIFVDACDSYVSPSGTVLWTESGIYQEVIPNAAGCDSSITIHLTIHRSTSSILNLTACDSLVSPSGQVWSTTGTFQDIIPNEAGCDSFMLINLTIINSSSSEISVSACDSYSFPGGSQIWTESGTYLEIIPNAVGCDSLITINLTINLSPSSEITVEACDSYSSPTGTQTWTESGTYVELIPVGGNCDSIITVNLTIHNSASVEVEVTACEMYASPDGIETWTESGIYLDTISTVAGCDSFIIVLLTIQHATASEINVTACDSYGLPGGSQIWTESGTYQDIIPNAGGCDSLVIVHLTIYNSSASDIIASACGSYSSPSSNYQWTESGIYADTIANVAGCDSIITIALTIINIDTLVTQVESVLIAMMAGATYQWIDCANGDLPIAGETDQQFNATASGNYAVLISSDGCSDTSACYAVTIVGTKDIDVVEGLKLYPNPASDYFVIEPGRQIGSGVIRVTDLQGKEVLTITYDGKEIMVVHFEGLAGMYIVTLTSAEYRMVGRVVVE